MIRMRLLIAVALVAGAAGAGNLWYLFFRPSGPAAVSLVGSDPAGSSSPAAASTNAVGASSDPAVSGSVAAESASGGIAGTWTVNTSIGTFSSFSDSFVGYRVQEELPSIGANTAVGRAPNVSGSMTIAGTTVTSVAISVDLTNLQSDDQRRDGQLHEQALQTDQFPTATFKLTQPIELGTVPTDGEVVRVTATGDLTLHGQTRSVQIPLQAKLSNGVIEVTGSLEIQFADFGITPPSSFLVLSVADHGTLELQLFFAKS